MCRAFGRWLSDFHTTVNLANQSHCEYVEVSVFDYAKMSLLFLPIESRDSIQANRNFLP
jgi:hypothetical protein